MRKNKLSLMEKEKTINLVKEKKFGELGYLFKTFNPLINKSYKKNINKKDKFAHDEFVSDCYVLILNCAENFKGNTYEELCTYITVTIEKRSLTIGQDYDKYRKYNILGEEEDNSLRIIEPYSKYFEERILSSLTLKSHCGKYAQNNLSEYDIEILKTHIYGGDLRELAERRGVKYASVMKALERALEKSRNVAVSLGITSNNDDYIIA